MVWSLELSSRLLHLALGGFVLLGLGAVAVRCCRQPVQRIRLIEWTLCGCLLLPVLQHGELLPELRLGLLPGTPAEVSLVTEESSSATLIAEEPMLPDAGDLDLESRAVSSPEIKSVGTELMQPEVSRTQSWRPTSRVAAVPAVAEHVPMASSQPTWPAWVIGAYGAGMLVLVLRFVLGVILRARLWRQATPAPIHLVHLLQAIAETEGGGNRSRRVRLGVSSQIQSPVTWGLLRPIVLVPASWLEESPTQLRCGLAHEWSHVERRDTWASYLVALVEIVFFYQPAYWWLKRVLGLSQDQLADSFALSESESPADYAQLLVTLARRERAVAVPGALGIVSRQSRLFRRITMLLNATEPLERRCRRLFSVAVVSGAVLLSAGLSAINLRSAPAEEKAPPATNSKADKPATPKAGNAKPDAAKPDNAKTELVPYTYKGKVTDRVTQKPIAGVNVLIELSLTRDPKTRAGGQKILRTINAQTDQAGKYEFQLTGEEHAASSLYVVVDAEHPNYASHGRGGYAHSMLQKNLRLGAPPWFANLRLWPGEPVEGVVVDPAGKPLADVEILTYAISSQAEGRFPRGAFGKTTTDKSGHFRIVVATPGDGALWLTPKKYCPQAHRLEDKRGDWGQFVMVEGTTVTGRVLDARGKPVPHVSLDARREGDGELVDQFLGQNAVANHIGREVKTDANGEFQLASLPAGGYRVRVETRDAETRQPVPDAPVFLEKRFTIPEDEQKLNVEVQAVPHVLVQGKMLNSQGKPTSGHEFFVFGQINGSSFFGQSNDPGNDGKLEMKVPHGLENVQISLMTNEHGVLRWRLSSGEPLQNGRRIKFDRLEEDLTTLEIVRYVAPILMVKAVDEAGQLIADYKPKAQYEKDSPKIPGSRFISGVNGDVNFDKQNDGRWRSNQLIPDQQLTLTIEKDGWETTPQTLSLAEKAEQEVVFVLKQIAK